MSSKTQKNPSIRFKGFTDAWEQREFKEILLVNSGRDYKHLEAGDIPVYGTGGYMLSVNDKLSDRDAIGLGRKGTIDKPQYLKAPFWTVDTLFYMIPKVNFDLLFLYSMTQKINWKRMDESTGVPSLSKAVIEKVKQRVPNIDEQSKIGKLFKQIDNTIALHQRQLNDYKQLKKSMLQKMFPQDGEKVPKIRFDGFTKEWEQRKLGDCFAERNERMSEGELISVTINSGVVKASSLDRKDNSSEDKSNYKKVEIGDIAYNSMRMWQGASGVSRYSGILSPAYTVIVPKKQISSVFFSYLFKLNKMIQTFQANSQGLTSDTWNLKYPVLKDIKVYVPNYEEQNKIGNFFKQLDDTIAFHQQKVNDYQQVKKALLQQMFV